ncbi:MAG: hypothetical protein WD873_05475 [Candidatus Hydrogenedentales bacterium]
MAVLDPKDYRRVAAYTDRGFLTVAGKRQELWLGPDHLVELQILRYSERSRRYYLADVRAITVDQTETRRLYSILWLGFAILFAAAAILLFTFSETNAVLLGLGAAATGGVVLMLLGLIRNATNGPTCRCVLHTAVQSADLFCLPRLRNAQRFLEQVVPAIEAAQGHVDPAAFEMLPDAATIPASPFALGSGRPIRHEPGAVHLALFTFLIFDAIVGSLLTLLAKNDAEHPLTMALLMVYIVLNLLAFVRQGHSDLSSSIKNVTWAAFALLVAGFIVGQAAGMIYIGMNPEEFSPYDVQVSMRDIAPVVHVFSGVEVIVGVAGAYLVAQHRRRHRDRARAAAAADI